jgi:GWxTD domain-containing protein
MHAPAAQALGLTLFHFLWEGAAIAAVLALALLVLKSSRARYAAACLALAVMPVVCGLTFQRVLPYQTATNAPLPQIIGQPPPGPGSPAVHPGVQPSDLLPYVVPFWLAGVLLLHARTLAGWTATRRLSRFGICAAPAHWQRRLAQLAAGVRLSKPVALLESCRVDVPLVAGYLRPVILVPLDLLSGLPAGQVEAILLHELAHIRRRDYLVNLLQAVVENLLFYHPAAWWVSGIIRAEREHCCDDLAVAVQGNAFEYASALTALETRRGAAEPALAATGGNLMKRVRRLLNRPEPRHTAFTPAVAAGIVILAAAAALTAWQPKPQEQPQTAAKESPYRRWMSEDVAYIITNEERTAFKNLQTDEEREHFIEQFWLRRDPTPGTPANEFKEEHYRRIAYANQHFTQPDGLAGWKTDRGRIYIVYGPPDEIESHPAGDAKHAFPYEQWMYRVIQGIGTNIIVEFNDWNHNGEYRMTADSSVPRASIWLDTVKRGPLVRKVRALGTVSDDGTVALNVAETVVKEVAIGQSASVDTGAGVTSGHVFHIEQAVNNRTVRVSITLNAPLPAGRAAKTVDGTIDIETVPDAVYVGRPVYGSANSDGSIFKIEPDGKHAVRVPVHFGRASVNQIEIVSGLVPGDKVILSDMSAYANYERIELK